MEIREEKITSFMETSRVPLSDFTDWYKKRHPKHIELLKDNEFIVVTGEAWRITVEIPHDCNCEYCEEKEEYIKDVEKESEIEKQIESLMFEYDIDDEDEFEVDKIFYVKAVRQNHDIGGLFK